MTTAMGVGRLTWKRTRGGSTPQTTKAKALGTGGDLADFSARTARASRPRGSAQGEALVDQIAHIVSDYYDEDIEGRWRECAEHIAHSIQAVMEAADRIEALEASNNQRGTDLVTVIAQRDVAAARIEALEAELKLTKEHLNEGGRIILANVARIEALEQDK